MKLGPETIRELLAQLDEHGWDELRLEIAGERLVLRRRATGEPETGTPVSAKAESNPESPPGGGTAPRSADSTDRVIRAAHVGIFWRRPDPASPPFVQIGDRVEADTTVGLIEVMKLFTPALAGLAGTVVETLAEDGQMVEFGSALFRLDPAAPA